MSLFEDDIADAVEIKQLQEPKAMPYCLGHEQQETLFLDLFSQDSLPHAMIFSGLEGVGKTTMAFRLARFLLKHGQDNDGGLFGEDLPQEFTTLDICVDDPVFSRVASGGHADILHIAREYNSSTNKQDATLKVDALRKIEPFLRKTSSEGGWRIVIVEDADTMNRSAQNAILKILEEPPQKVLIILVAHSSGALIPTIKSRSRLFSFDALPQKHIQTLLEHQGHELSMSDTEALTAISMGSAGHALKLIEEDGLQVLSKILSHIGASGSKLHTLSNSLSSAAQDKQYRLFVDLMQWVFRHMLFLKARGINDLPNHFNNNELDFLFKAYSLKRLINICDNLNNHFDRVDFSNLDRRDAIRSAFLMIESEGC